MKKIKTISEDEMISIFLKGEIDSPRCLRLYNQLLNEYGVTRNIIDNPNLLDNNENKLRSELLSKGRGYKWNTRLFINFPEDIRWKRVVINKNELLKLKHAKFNEHTYFSGSRLVAEIAQNITAGTSQAWQDYRDGVTAIVQAVKSGKIYPELICVTNEAGNDLILLDGHYRTTAYVSMLDVFPEELEMIVGFSKNIDKWAYY